MLEIYGSPKSSARRCYWCLEEAGVKYRAHAVDFRAKEHKSPQYLKMNPNGKVPTLVDGDLVLWESMAINFYIGDAYKQDLIGHTTRERAPIRQWSFWAISELQPALIEAFIELEFVPVEKRDADKITKALEKTRPRLELLESIFENTNYLVANRFTLADLNVASVVEINQHINNDLSGFSRLSRWLATVQERPAYQRLKSL
jgi:glutathione S-transferase